MNASLRAAAAVLALALAAEACGRVPSGARRKSQPAMLVQRIGGTELTVRYNRPSARGRRLFGGIVPWDSVWCPGADEATQLRTTSDLAIGSAVLPGGAYTLWMVPDSAGAWTVIFSRAADAYHVPYPGTRRDALRVRIHPRAAPYVETLEYALPVATPDSAVLEMRWGDVAVPIPFRPR
ncbi:DUF2911 domain-containing protein [Longimicrobium sp.]|uniref:DUF2911 domain-containing protein n=1 Tax=Longimicrobium sp. TaxID=2029185 RepID=UPI002C4F67AA|nr:DUF2911 domain-containing protein [Longimicrobium sp.]HSU14913.1 DUF2911 domain-containing protein [Longimicrobium sp.]